MDVDTSSYTSGVWTFDEALRKTLGARRFEARVDTQFVGEIALGAEHNWVWGWGRAMRRLGVQRGDVLRAVLNIEDSTADIIKGGRELWDRPA